MTIFTEAIQAAPVLSLGDDLVVDAARASFGHDHTQYSTQQNIGLINYLARHSHWTPFSHNRFTFRLSEDVFDVLSLTQEEMAGLVIKRDHTHPYRFYARHSFHGWANILKNEAVCPDIRQRIQARLQREMPVSSAAYFKERSTAEPLELQDIRDAYFIDVTLMYHVPVFVARQEFKHMVGFTRNERSGRYVSSDIELYAPDKWRRKPDDGIKQGSGEDVDPVRNEITNRLYREYMGSILGAYTGFLNSGIAPEMARMALPQSMMTSYVVTGHLAAYNRFFMERRDPTAQKENRVDLVEAASTALRRAVGQEVIEEFVPYAPIRD